MTGTVDTIRRMIAAAKALGAPDFKLTNLLMGAEVIEADRAARYAASGNSFLNVPDVSDLDRDEDAILLAAEHTFAFCACKVLPKEMAWHRADNSAQAVRLAGIDVALARTGVVIAEAFGQRTWQTDQPRAQFFTAWKNDFGTVVFDWHDDQSAAETYAGKWSEDHLNNGEIVALPVTRGPRPGA